MSPLVILFITVFALALMGGLVALTYYNRFSEKQVRIREALDNISLFWGQRQSGLESLLPMLEHFDQAMKSDLERAQVLANATHQDASMPGRTDQSSEADRLARRIMSNLRTDSAKLHVQQILDRLERAETELNGARRYHNALVREHNTMVKGFPSAMVALIFRIQEMSYLTIEQE